MKSYAKLMIVVASVVGTADAFAGLVCDNMQADGGYKVEFSNRSTRAKLTANNYAGASEIGRFSCVVGHGNPACDAPRHTECTGPDRSFHLSLYEGGWGGSSVKVYRNGDVIAEIACQYR